MSLFQFKYFNKGNLPKSDPSPADLTRPDGNLELNIGKINIVFLYRFITELMVSASVFCAEKFPLLSCCNKTQIGLLEVSVLENNAVRLTSYV